MHTAFSQSVRKDALQKKITLTGQSMSFEEILRQLTSQSKLYFIYSSNSVEVNKRVSLNLHQLPLSEVLGILGERMNLTFRKEGDYVVVKKSMVDKSTMIKTKTASPQQDRINSRAEKVFFDGTGIDAKENMIASARTSISMVEDLTLSIPYHILQKNLLYCPSGFSFMDTSVFKKYAPLKITNPHPKRYVFTSMGLIANEYAGSIEIRMGFPSLYAVLNGGLMSKGYFRTGYGLGTSLLFKPGIFLKPIYTFSTLKVKEDYAIDKNARFYVQDGLNITRKHHQLKLTFQFNASNRIAFHVGPTFNLLKTSYIFSKRELPLSDQPSIIFIRASKSSPDPNSGISSGRIAQSTYFTTPTNYNTTKYWMGFEVGVSYSLKFPIR